MSEINTIVFDQKTIDELDVYIPQDYGELIEDIPAQEAKLPIYINQTTKKDQEGVTTTETVEKTLSINVRRLQELMNLTNNLENQVMTEQDLDPNSPNYNSPMVISPALLTDTISSSISSSKKIATQQQAGLMSPEDKAKLDNFNLKNGSSIGSLRTTGSDSEDSSYTIGRYAFAEGQETEASGIASHAEGYNTIAEGSFSHANGNSTIAAGESQTVIGKYNISDENNEYSLIIGNGDTNTTRSNLLTIDWQGNATLSGKIITSGEEPTEDNELVSKQYVDELVENTSSQASSTALSEIGYDIGTTKKSLLNTDFIDLIYPVGSIYISVNSANPRTLFGGRWEQIKKTFLFAANDSSSNVNYHGGGTGGAETVTLTDAQSGLRSHTHEFTNPTTKTETVNSGGMSDHTNHTHAAGSFTDKNKKEVTAAFIRFNYGTVTSGGISEYRVATSSSGSCYVLGSANSKVDYNGGSSTTETAKTNIAHTHSVKIPKLETTGGAVKKNEADSATKAHENMPPFLSVYMWKRTS